jgi:UDP-N-acetylmuramate dehydrogenase
LKQWRDGWSYISPLQVAQAISTIRASKLPDWTKIGTCGSFFANPIITTENYETLKKEFPDLVWHTAWTNKTKLSAGQLIELCGLKGYRDDDAGVYELHALVLVNYGNATGTQVKNLITMIQNEVKKKFNIEIKPEVNVI